MGWYQPPAEAHGLLICASCLQPKGSQEAGKASPDVQAQAAYPLSGWAFSCYVMLCRVWSVKETLCHR